LSCPSVCVRVDGSYVDPLGPQQERPRTAARRRDQTAGLADEFNNEQIGDDLLPDWHITTHHNTQRVKYIYKYTGTNRVFTPPPLKGFPLEFGIGYWVFEYLKIGDFGWK